MHDMNADPAATAEPSTTELAALTTGHVWLPTDAGRAGYDRERAGFNTALDHQPAVLLAATTPADITEGVRFAADHRLPVDVQATGHGAHQSVHGGLLITTRGLTGVEVDPVQRVARISAGATAADVLAATCPLGLTAPVGASPGVGYVSYSLGGGIGPVGRTLGFGADHVRRLDVITADGVERTVTADQDPDLFWALRGGGGNLAVVTGIEVDLAPVADIYGGALFFAGEDAPEVLEAFSRCTDSAPSELNLSVAFLTYPDLPALPEAIRGRSCCHVRIAYVGSTEAARPHVVHLDRLAPLLDTRRRLPMSEIGTIHADPTGPTRVNSNSLTLGDSFSPEHVAPFVAPDVPYVLELRHLGGTLAREPETPNAVGHRTASFNLFTSAYPDVDPVTSARAQQRVVDALLPVSDGGPLRTFLPPGLHDATTCYSPGMAAELARLKSVWDPADTFGYAPAITPPAS
ncbi:FAD-binding oxidoreductase [Nocardioides sp.]|uniref:FAD-binding oxidoreductase n=1 Tax=Nocardioides sp. TaxID=35761 RepID=UPI003D0BC3F5